jgi:hypothetical protein
MTYANPTQKAWNTYKIPMSDFTGLKSVTHLSQLIFGGTPTGSGVLYIDNVYFSKTATSVSQANAKPVVTLYPNPSNKTVTLNCETMMDEIAIFSTSGTLVKTLSNVKPNQSIDISGLAAGIYHISVKTTAEVSGIQLVVQ